MPCAASAIRSCHRFSNTGVAARPSQLHKHCHPTRPGAGCTRPISTRSAAAATRPRWRSSSRTCTGADRATRDLLSYLIRGVGTPSSQARVLVLLTYRSDELTRTSPVRTWLAELLRLLQLISRYPADIILGADEPRGLGGAGQRRIPPAQGGRAVRLYGRPTGRTDRRRRAPRRDRGGAYPSFRRLDSPGTGDLGQGPRRRVESRHRDGAVHQPKTCRCTSPRCCASLASADAEI
jgi:hypothetical protein